MREMNRESGVAFVMISHDDRLAQAADRILLIENGLVHEIRKEDHRRGMAQTVWNDASRATQVPAGDPVD